MSFSSSPSSFQRWITSLDTLEHKTSSSDEDNTSCMDDDNTHLEYFKVERDTFHSDEATIWSQLKESGAILQQLIQLQQESTEWNPKIAQEETNLYSQPTMDTKNHEEEEDDNTRERPKTCLFPVHTMVEEYRIEDKEQEKDLLWDKLLCLFLPTSTVPIGCIQFAVKNNLFSARILRHCFYLLCPWCNPNISSKIDMSKLCLFLLSVFDRRTDVGGKMNVSSTITRASSKWVPSWQDWVKLLCHLGMEYSENDLLHSCSPITNKQNISKPLWISTWKRILKLMVACIPYVSRKDILQIVPVMTRILLDPLGFEMRDKVVGILYRCWVALGGTCQQLVLLVNEYFVSVFLKYSSASLYLQMRLWRCILEWQALSQYFAYKLFILYTEREEEQQQQRCWWSYMLCEKIQHQVGNFLVSFLNDNLVYGADIEILSTEDYHSAAVACTKRKSGSFQKFIYPLLFEMKESSSLDPPRQVVVWMVDMLETRWQFGRDTWSEHEATSFYIKQVEPLSLLKYHFKESFQCSEWLDRMEQLARNKNSAKEDSCTKDLVLLSSSSILVLAIFALQPNALSLMNTRERQRLEYAISVLKNTCGGFSDPNSAQIAVYLGQLHMIAECMWHSTETLHSGVYRETEQLTLSNWFAKEEEE